MVWQRIVLIAMAVLFALVPSSHAQTPSNSGSTKTTSSSSSQPDEATQSSTFDHQSMDTLSQKQYKATNAPDKYDPSHPDLNRTFNMSSKGFSTPAVTSVDQDSLQHLTSFHTKTFGGNENSFTLPKSVVPNSQPYQDKSYPALPVATFNTPTFHVSGSRTSNFTQTFSVPAKPVFAAQPAYTADKAYPDSNKAYQGPETEMEKDSMNALRKLSSVSKVPDRPLTVDEVKSLLNRGHLPDDEEQDVRPALPASLPEDNSSLPVAPSLPALPLEGSVKPAEPLVLPQR